MFGDGCGTAAGAGLIDEVVLGCARGDTAAPEFTFLPRALCKKENSFIREKKQLFRMFTYVLNINVN